MRVNVAIPEEHVQPDVLNAALESVTRLNEKMLHSNEVPTFERALKHGIKWRPEPPGQEHFDHAKTVLARRWGDCDDLAPWHAASLRHTGEDPGAHAIVKRSGPHTWHAVVQRSSGDIDDPSKRAGMGQHNGVNGAVLPLMWPLPPPGVNGAYIVRPQIALRPVRGAFQARADLPWYWREHLEDDKPSPSDYAMTALHTAPIAHSALTGAVDGIIELADVAGFGADHDIERLCCVSDAIHGIAARDPDTFYRLRDEYSPADVQAAANVVGSFFSHIAHALSPIANVVAPIARQAIPFIPGVGPIADKALDFASHIPGFPGIPGLSPGAAAIDHGPAGATAAPGGGGHGYTCRYF